MCFSQLKLSPGFFRLISGFYLGPRISYDGNVTHQIQLKKIIKYKLCSLEHCFEDKITPFILLFLYETLLKLLQKNVRPLTCQNAPIQKLYNLQKSQTPWYATAPPEGSIQAKHIQCYIKIGIKNLPYSRV